jgi:hypothetical protein
VPGPRRSRKRARILLGEESSLKQGKKTNAN